MSDMAKQDLSEKHVYEDEKTRPGLAARRTAVQLLSAIIDKKTPLDALCDNDNGHPKFLALELRDRLLVRAMLNSALRHRNTIQSMIERRLDRALPENARTLIHILHIGAAQILFLKVPDSAAVDLAVAHAHSDPRVRRFGKLVNAILRNIARGGPRSLEAALHQNRDAPKWFIDKLEHDYGADACDEILRAHRREAPIDFTVKSDAQKWAEQLGGTVLPTGSVRVERPDGPIVQLPGFEDGQWWVQDSAAALPALLFGDVKGKRIGDLCAAPGGKTAQLAHFGAHVTAIDISSNRLKRLQQNFERLQLDGEVIGADLNKYKPDELFDGVLLDAPCSSTGTVRRHPDVIWTKTPDDVDRLARLQMKFLNRSVDLVKPGGIIVYSNCSVLCQEGEDLIEAFIKTRKDVVIDPIEASEHSGLETFITGEGYLRTLPNQWASDRLAVSGLDGFFAVRLRRLE